MCDKMTQALKGYCHYATKCISSKDGMLYVLGDISNVPSLGEEHFRNLIHIPFSLYLMKEGDEITAQYFTQYLAQVT